MSGAAVVEARGVTVRRGRVTVVDGVALAVHAGEVVAVVGPNGAGKSTLLGVLAGDERPVTGEAMLDGRPATGWSALERARRRAVVAQSTPVAFGFTVEEVVAMGRSPWAGTPLVADDDEAVASALARTDVSHLRSRRADTLSGGEQARVTLARALAQGTPVLLLDEPTASLDVAHVGLVLGECRRHADAGGAVVVVLHDLTTAARWADRVLVLDRGRAVACGPPRDALDAALLSRVYGCELAVLRPRGARGPVIVPV